jgi:hypothetical protein
VLKRSNQAIAQIQLVGPIRAEASGTSNFRRAVSVP